MADPLSILGVAVGVTSLVIQVTDECIKGIRLYHEALGMPDAYRYLRVRLQIEQQRFVSFSLEAGILYTDGVLCATLQVNRSLLLAVLAEIQVLLTSYAKSNGRYEDMAPHERTAPGGPVEPGSDLIDLLCLPKVAETQDASDKTTKRERLKGLRSVGRSIAQTGRNLRTIVKEPRRLIWVKFDRDSFEGLISKIADLNTFLISLLDTSQIKRLQDVVSKAYLEILQVRGDIGNLMDLVKSLSLPEQDHRASSSAIGGVERHLFLSTANRDRKREQATRQYLKKLVEIKIRYNRGNQPIDGGSVAPDAAGPAPQLNLGDFTLPQDDSKDHQSDTRIDVEYKGKHVWIEWKFTAVTDEILLSDIQQIQTRVQLLTDLLCYEKPEDFRAPSCLGYVKSVESDAKTYFGVVFERPLKYDQGFQLTTLRDLLGQAYKPSLSHRIKLCMILARSVLNFQAVGWLHKGVRSDNIILFCPPASSTISGHPDLTSPYVSGFDLARPGIIDSMTEKPRSNPAEDIYRHPFAQSSQSSGKYRRSFDIYSLGIVFLEIAMWMHVEDVIGLGDIGRVKPSTLQEIQPWLLGRTYRSNTSLPHVSTTERSCLQRVASECGDTFCSVIENCLTMDEAEKIQYPGEPESSVAIRVQRITQEEILGSLERMALVL